MLAELVNREVAEPLTPDGWVFVVDAMIACMNSVDDQHASAHRLKRASHTYVDLHALAPTDSIKRNLARGRISDNRLADVRMAAFNAAAIIAKACEAGRVRSATRHHRGGPLVPLPAYKWGLDDPWPRIWRCQMDPKYPFALNVGHWIFFEQNALYEEIDAWRLQHGLERKWTMEPLAMSDSEPVTAQANSLETKAKGGRPLETELWTNFLAVALDFMEQNDWPTGTPGEVYTVLEDYAARIGLPILGRTSGRAALFKVGKLLHSERDEDGTPKINGSENPE